MSQLKQALVNSIVSILNAEGQKADDIVKKYDVNATDVSLIRRNKAMEFTLDKVVRIAESMGVTFTYVVGEREPVGTIEPVEPIKPPAPAVEKKAKRLTKEQKMLAALGNVNFEQYDVV